MNLKKLIVLIVVLVSLTVLSAQDTAKIEKLLKITKSDEMLEQVFSQMKAMQAQQLRGMQLTPEQQKIIEKYNDKMFDILKPVLKWDAIKGDLIKLYSDNFSDKEINDLIKFYSSETGKAFVDKMPIVMQASMQIGQMKVQSVTQKLMEISQQMATEIQSTQKTVPSTVPGN